MLGKSPERDREIDDICQMIRNARAPGIPALKYNLTLLGVSAHRHRRRAAAARATARSSTTSAKQDPPLTEAGMVGRGHLLGAHHLLPRARRAGGRGIQGADGAAIRRIRACRAARGFRGVDAVLGSVDGLKRFVAIKESPYHGLNFCQGTVSEMLEKPGEQIFDVIRYFGSRKKIFNVHFRNIRGGFLNFQETFIDDGDVDMLKAMRVYKEVGYDGMMMPDHVPPIDGDARGAQAFAFAFGYIKALIAAVNAET